MCTNESQADSIPYLQNANSSPHRRDNTASGHHPKWMNPYATEGWILSAPYNGWDQVRPALGWGPGLAKL
ncbi:hypothetical protein A3852_08775 [Rhodococcus qingshengii]|jgi:hypothetical protein|nr:hypothetical protein A0W34_00330 [Rhodococcus sp. BH4]KZL32484.1 hypothetical protein A3852_08775 [Rhodococcus qingshengii]MBW0291263.1 hypothetical protein [Rhodococcus sp. MH15]ORC24747.1 hypothetical protein BXO91_16250 [Rhodococcus qingshengii]